MFRYPRYIWAVFWDDLVVWDEDHNVLNHYNGILKLYLKIRVFCLFIEISINDHLNTPVTGDWGSLRFMNMLVV